MVVVMVGDGREGLGGLDWGCLGGRDDGCFLHYYLALNRRRVGHRSGGEKKEGCYRAGTRGAPLRLTPYSGLKA